ncbi:sporulation protein YunB [Oscillibacter sp.]|uniref:sporulation protein YunB n=1 Tax=Oscillibacter sp. TaxID=1945593 RepID=UPI00261FA73A|nr:sporulation protein YunB [Oscillibacter sp.]MDD3346446.1 sporulation protein YunB [Oscillibacter sp.]
MRPGFFYYRRRPDRRTVTRFLAFLAAALVLWAALYATAQLRPLLESLATTRVSNTVNRIVTEAVREAIEKGEISYTQLISFEKDTEGRITAVHSNMAAFNRLQSDVLDIILTRVNQVSARELSIPVGTLTGTALLAGRGPRITVRMESVGSSSAWFTNEFESAGINQTKHRIVLHIDVYVSILLPGFAAATKISNVVTVAETIIVGSVPDTYTYFSTTPSTYEEDLKDYILNGQ